MTGAISAPLWLPQPGVRSRFLAGRHPAVVRAHRSLPHAAAHPSPSRHPAPFAARSTRGVTR
jgi:hypothetical protein